MRHEYSAEYRNSLREAVVVLALWLVCFTWAVGYCYLSGYAEHPRVPGDVSSLTPDLSRHDRTVASLTTPGGWGVPDWALWGILVPWGLCIAVTFLLCLSWMRDDPETAVTPPCVKDEA